MAGLGGLGEGMVRGLCRCDLHQVRCGILARAGSQFRAALCRAARPDFAHVRVFSMAAKIVEVSIKFHRHKAPRDIPEKSASLQRTFPNSLGFLLVRGSRTRLRSEEHTSELQS